jgi:hypothetical protein
MSILSSARLYSTSLAAIAVATAVAVLSLLLLLALALPALAAAAAPLSSGGASPCTTSTLALLRWLGLLMLLFAATAAAGD